MFFNHKFFWKTIFLLFCFISFIFIFSSKSQAIKIQKWHQIGYYTINVATTDDMPDINFQTSLTENDNRILSIFVTDSQGNYLNDYNKEAKLAALAQNLSHLLISIFTNDPIFDDVFKYDIENYGTMDLTTVHSSYDDKNNTYYIFAPLHFTQTTIDRDVIENYYMENIGFGGLNQYSKRKQMYKDLFLSLILQPHKEREEIELEKILNNLKNSGSLSLTAGKIVSEIIDNTVYLYENDAYLDEVFQGVIDKAHTRNFFVFQAAMSKINTVFKGVSIAKTFSTKFLRELMLQSLALEGAEIRAQILSEFISNRSGFDPVIQEAFVEAYKKYKEYFNYANNESGGYIAAIDEGLNSAGQEIKIEFFTNTLPNIISSRFGVAGGWALVPAIGYKAAKFVYEKNDAQRRLCLEATLFSPILWEIWHQIQHIKNEKQYGEADLEYLLELYEIRQYLSYIYFIDYDELFKPLINIDRFFELINIDYMTSGFSRQDFYQQIVNRKFETENYWKNNKWPSFTLTESESTWLLSKITRDIYSPEAYINKIEQIDNSKIKIYLNGTDTGLGIKYYDIQKKVGDNGDWHNLVISLSDTIFTTSLDLGNKYYFRARAKDYALNLGEWSDSKSIELSNIHQLYGQKYSPQTGLAGDLFYFYINYKNSSNLMPLSAKVNINGINYDMIKKVGEIRNGAVFHMLISISDSSVPYYFEFTDTEGTLRDPVSGTYTGPVLNSMLYSNTIDPLTIDSQKLITFQVYYKHQDGISPTKSKLILTTGNTTTYANMGKISGDIKTGALYQTKIYVPANSWEHYFEFSDGQRTYRLPVSGKFSGPLVNSGHDIAVSALELYPSDLKAGQTGTIRVEVENYGTENEDNIPLAVYANGLQIGDTILVRGLNLRSTNAYTFNWTVPILNQDTTFTITTVLNPVSGESITSNNTKTSDHFVYALPGIFEGYVYDKNSNPVESAEVSILSGPDYGSVFTDDTGYYKITTLKPGNYTIRAYKESIGSQTKSNILLNANSLNNQNFNITLEQVTQVTNQPTGQAPEYIDISPDGNWILFCAKDVNGTRRIYKIKSNGSGLSDLGNPYPNHWSQPRFSPDASEIVFLQQNLYLMNSDGSNIRNLSVAAQSPAWFPDGQKIGYAYDKSFYTINKDGTNNTKIADLPANIYSLDISKDGKKVIFLLTNTKIYYYNLEDSQSTELGYSNIIVPFESNIRWLPNSEQFIYLSNVLDQRELYVGDIYNNESLRITFHEWGDQFSSINSSGETIAFLTKRYNSIYGPFQIAVKKMPQVDFRIYNVSLSKEPYILDSYDSTTIFYSINQSGYVTIRIYDYQFNLVKYLKNNEYQTQGSYSVEWDGKNLYSEQVKSQVYICVIDAIDTQGNKAKTYELPIQVYSGLSDISYTGRFSPDGKNILYSSSDKIYIYNISSGNVTEISGLNGNYPDWISNNRIVFQKKVYGILDPNNLKEQIFAADTNGANITQITFDNDESLSSGNLYSCVSLDKTKIIYFCQFSGKNYLKKMGIDGSNKVKIKEVNQITGKAYLHSNIGKIAYCDAASGELISDLYIMNEDGTNEQRIAISNVHEGEPIIDPSGKFVYYYSALNNQGNIMRIKIDGSEKTWFIRNLNPIAAFDVSPDGKKIVFGDAFTYTTKILNLESDWFYGTISGKVIELDNYTPVPAADVYLLKDGDTVSSTKSSSDGSYSFSNLVYGDYTLFVEKPHYDSAMISLSLTAGEISSANNLRMYKLPIAYITHPDTNALIRENIPLKAESSSSNIAFVQFQYQKQGETIWHNIGTKVTSDSMERVWDVLALESNKYYYLRALASDTNGKEDNMFDSVMIFLDKDAPKFTIVSPENGDTVGKNITITAISNDTDIEKCVFQYQILGETMWVDITEDNDSPYSVTWSNNTMSSNIYYVLRAVGWDVLGNIDVNADTILIYFDIIAPEIKIQGISEGGIIKDTAELSYSTQDIDIDKPIFEYKATSETLWIEIGRTSPIIWLTENLQTGYYNLRVRGLDKTGNESETVPIITVYVDHTAPVVNLIYPFNEVSITDTILIKATSYDNDIKYIKFQYSSDSENWTEIEFNDTVSPFNLEWDVSSFSSDSIYYCRIKVSDNVYNISYSDTIKVTIDHDSPSITSIILNSGDTYTNQFEVSVSITATGASEMNLSETYTMYSDSYVPFVSKTIFTFSSGQGQKTLYVKLRDPAFNESSIDSVSIIIDTQTPVISSFEINNGDTITFNPFVSYTIDTDTDVNKISISEKSEFYTDNWKDFNSSDSFVLTSGEDTKYIYIKVKDRAGNISEIKSDSIILTNYPFPAQNFSGIPLEGNKIKLSWLPSISLNAETYNIYYDSSTGIINYDTKFISVSYLSDSITIAGLGSGKTYKFGIRVMNSSGIEEKNTNIITGVTIQEVLSGAKAIIKIPKSGKKISGNRVLVKADTIYGSVNKVLFQFKNTNDTEWIAITSDNIKHPNPDTSAPFFICWDVLNFTQGDYDIRAIAYDENNIPDSYPNYITITIDHLNPDIIENLTNNYEFKKVIKLFAGMDNTIDIGELDKNKITTFNFSSKALTGEVELEINVLNPLLVSIDSTKYQKTDEFREINIIRGQTTFDDTIEISIPFNDEDNDGIIDGTKIRSTLVKIFRYNETTEEWEKLENFTLDNINKTIKAELNSFSKFGLMKENLKGDVYANESDTFPNIPDGIVDINDFKKISEQYNKKAGDSNYNPDMDIIITDNSEDKIDFEDISEIGKNYGKTQ